jgi:N-acetylneuraminate lyase
MIIAHVGHSSAGDARALAQHAQAAGADAIAAVAPSFFKPTGVRELVEWCAEVAAAAPRLPFFYYHIPSMSGVTVPTAAFLAEARTKIPTLAGIKFTYEDLDDYRATRAIGGDDYDVLFGRDEILLTGLQAGATGAVGSTYNYASPLYLRIMRAFAAGDRATAEREQVKARAFIDVMVRFGGQPAGKAIMKLIGLDCGPVRLPMRALTTNDEAALRAALETVGFFEFSSKPVA